jgi:hypothetical protein
MEGSVDMMIVCLLLYQLWLDCVLSLSLDDQASCAPIPTFLSSFHATLHRSLQQPYWVS